MTDAPDFNDYNGSASYPENGYMARFGKRSLGVGIIITCIFACVALTSWNIEDRSLTHATDGPVTNILGFAGSAISDLLIQFFGLAAILIVSLPIIWGLQLYNERISFIDKKKIGYFVGTVLLAGGTLSCFPVPESWPLPTGLGGITGNALLFPVYYLSSEALSSATSLILAVLLTLPLPFLIYRGFLHSDSDQETESASQSRRRPKISTGDEDEETAEHTWLPFLAGAATHWLYLGATTMKRLMTGRRERMRMQHVPQHDMTLDDESMRPSRSLLNRLSQWKQKLIDEPVADDGLGDYLAKVDSNPSDSDFMAEPFTETDSHSDNSHVDLFSDNQSNDRDAGDSFGTTRIVSKVAPKAKPGKRIIAEAQPTLPIMKDPDQYELPPLNFLTEAPIISEDQRLSNDVLAHNAELLEGVLDDFGVKGEIVHVRPGPVVTLYELEPAPGIKSSRVIGLADDIARSMSAIAARVAVIPGKNAIGIELPNSKRETVYFHEAVASKNYENNKGKLPICLGKTIGGETVIADLARMPHLLVAGTTGSGKSVAINTMILSLLYRFTPEDCKLIMIDPKMLELSVYDGIPHLLTPVVTDPKKAVVALKWTVREMEDRYKKMSKVGVRNIDGFNARVKQATEKGEPIVRTIQTGYDQETGEAIYEREELDMSPMPYIVVIIDEMADLMMVAGKDIEGAVQRLAQMARAAGIHVIMATQRPSVDVITGTIKANFPTRISFQVTSKIDSRTILGEQGAEQLLGMGDMLYMAGGGRIQRVHGPFVSDEEVENVVRHLQDQGVPRYVDAVTEEVDEGDGDAASGSGSGNVSDDADPYDQAVAIVLRDKKASTSYIQRRLGIGYNRAATIIERMEEEGIIGPANHAGKREILVGSDPDEDFG